MASREKIPTMTMNDPSSDETRFDHWPVSRRQFVRLSAATAGVLTISGNATAASSSAKLTDLYEFITEHVEADFAIPTLIELSSTAGFDELRALGHDLITTTAPTTAAYTTLQPDEVADVVAVDAVTQLRYSPGSNPFWRLDYYPNGVFPAVDESVDFIDFEQFVDGIDHLQSRNTDRMRYYSVGDSPGHYNLFLDEPGPQNLWVVEVTNDVEDEAAFAEKEKVLFPLSIHGDERSGAEAGTRFIERLLDGREPETEALLDDIVIVFLYPNPDGWVARDPRYYVDEDPDPNNFKRTTATGVDPNRQYPTVGWINAGYYPAEPNGSDLMDDRPGIDADVPSVYTETVPDALDIVEFLRGYENLRIGSDLHGKFWSTAFMDGLIVNDQYDTRDFHDLYEWNRRTQERLEAALTDRLDAAQDQFAALNDEYGEEAFGIPNASRFLPEPEETFTYGTILDTIGYTTTGDLIGWMSQPEDQGGLDILMMAHEMGWDNRVVGRIDFRPWLVGLQVTGYMEVIRETVQHAVRDVSATIKTGDATATYVDTETLTRTSAALSFGDASRRTRTTQATVGHKPESVTVEVPSTAESLSLTVRPKTGFVLAKLRAPDGRVVRTFNPMAGGASDPSQTVEWTVTSPTSGTWTVELKTIRGTDETTVTVDSAVLLGSEETYDAPDPKEVLGYQQRPYSVTPLAYFPDYAEYIADAHGRGGKRGKRGKGNGNRGRGNITEEMVGLGVEAIANGGLFHGNSNNLAVENLVITHEEGRSNADYVAALDTFVANDGNLVLTDRGIALLGVMSNDRAAAFSSDDIAEIEMVSGALSERVAEHPMLADTRPIQRELWKTAPVGHPIGTAPVTVIDPAAFEAAGGSVAGYSRGDPAGPPPSKQYVSAGSLADGDDTGIHVIGGLLPPAEQSSLHPFGMCEYTASFLGHTMLTNALGYQQVRFVNGEPVLRFGSLR